METLPLEMVWKIALNLLPKDLLHFCETRQEYGSLCQDENFWKEYFENNPSYPKDISLPFWARKAEADFGFPKETFPFAGKGKLPPKDRYVVIKNYIPPPQTFLLINQMCVQWSESTNTWKSPMLLDYPMNPTFYRDKNLQSLPPKTREEADKFLDWLDTEDPLEEEFTKSNHVYLNLDYGVSRHILSLDRTVSLHALRQTLVRGEGDDNVTYRNILENTRNLFPKIKSHGTISKYTWKGFSPDGIPTLEVDIDW